MNSEKNYNPNFYQAVVIGVSAGGLDALFETASELFGQCLIGVVLTPANQDGSREAVKNLQFGKPI